MSVKLKDLNEHSKNIRVKVKVLKKIRDLFVKCDSNDDLHHVANYEIIDDTGSFSLIVWDDEIDKIPINECILINNANVIEFGGFPCLNIGKEGNWVSIKKIEKI